MRLTMWRTPLRGAEAPKACQGGVRFSPSGVLILKDAYASLDGYLCINLF